MDSQILGSIFERAKVVCPQSSRAMLHFMFFCALCFIDQLEFRFILLIPLCPAMTRASTHVFVFSNRGFQCILNCGGVRMCNCNRVQFCGYLRFFMSTVIISRRFTALQESSPSQVPSRHTFRTRSRCRNGRVCSHHLVLVASAFPAHKFCIPTVDLSSSHER